MVSGMNYLHAEAPVKVIHRDLKSKNGNYEFQNTTVNNLQTVEDIKTQLIETFGVTIMVKIFVVIRNFL